MMWAQAFHAWECVQKVWKIKSVRITRLKFVTGRNRILLVHSQSFDVAHTSLKGKHQETNDGKYLQVHYGWVRR